MSWINYEVAELTWEKGQPSLNGLGSSPRRKQVWVSTGPNNDTLESIVHHATSLKPPLTPSNPTSDFEWRPVVADSSRKRSKTVSNILNNKRRIWDFNRNNNDNENVFSSNKEKSVGTVMMWPLSASFQTHPDDYDDKEKKEEKESSKTETTTSSRSLSSISRRSRASDVHNQSERRRRDRINQKMKALQKLVPNANKTDKASMLDEVTDYLRQLQAQVEMMNIIRSMKPPQPHLMMVPNIDLVALHHQQLQMSLFGSEMGMNPSSSSSIRMPHLLPPTTFMTNITSPFLLSHHAANMNINNNNNSTCKRSGEAHLSSSNVVQPSMDVELYLKNMAAMYQQ